MEFLFAATVLLFFLISFYICFFLKTKEKKDVRLEKNDSARRIMAYVHNKNSSDGVHKYIESYNKISGFKPNYIGWK